MKPQTLAFRYFERLNRFRRSTRGGVISVEFLLILPIMIWAYVGTMVFFDAFRARAQAQSAALHVADLLSRQTEQLSTAYLENLNDIYDFLAPRAQDTRLRISLVIRPDPEGPPLIAWSHGTRGLLPLDQVSQMMSMSCMGDPDGNGNNDPLACYDAAASAAIPENSGRFTDPRYHLPVADLPQRVEPVMTGESLIVVESFTAWRTPSASVLNMPILNNMRITPVAVTRPRFSPFINYEGAAIDFESSGEEMPPVWEPPPPEEDDVVDEEPAASTVVVVDTDFTAGTPPEFSHSNVTHTSHPVAGSYLGPFGRETRNNPVTYGVNLGGESQRATIEFDLLIIDSWDGWNRSWALPEGELFLLQVNGSSISAESFHQAPWGYYLEDRLTVASRAEGHFTTTMTRIMSGQNITGAGWNDQIWRVTVEIDSPDQIFTLGFAAILDEDVSNESFGLMNFRVTAERAAQDPQHYVPDAASLMGLDPLLRFPVHTGCPEPQQAAPTHNMTQDHIGDPLFHRVRARGQQRLNNCGIPGIGNNPSNGSRVLATPTYILDWTDLGWRSGAQRLRIRTDDGNNGQSCDSSLLVRDPTGAWLFNEDIKASNPDRNWNARLNLGWAPSGEYHIWVGHWNDGSCNVDLVIERY